MTKRFIETISTGIVTDNQTGKEYNCEMRIDDDFLNLVNIIVDENEQLKKENKELKFDNDIKFWKLQFMKEYNSHQLIMHELSLAIDAGYTISDDFQKYLDSLREQNKKNIEKAERLGI